MDYVNRVEDDASLLEDQTVVVMTGAFDVPDGYARLVGRPRLGEQYEPSAVIQFRVPRSWKQVVKQDAASYGMSVSEYLRFLVARNHLHPSYPDAKRALES